MGKSPHGQILRLVFLKVQAWTQYFLFLIFINDLPKGLSSNAKLFADDTSLFSVIYDSRTPRNEFHDDLVKINDWVYQLKMSFNPDPNKQTRKVIFSRKTKKIKHPF